MVLIVARRLKDATLTSDLDLVKWMPPAKEVVVKSLLVRESKPSLVTMGLLMRMLSREEVARGSRSSAMHVEVRADVGGAGADAGGVVANNSTRRYATDKEVVEDEN